MSEKIRKTIIALTILTAIVCGASFGFAPKTVTISEEIFKCVETQPNGLFAECVGYKKRVY